MYAVCQPEPQPCPPQATSLVPVAFLPIDNEMLLHYQRYTMVVQLQTHTEGLPGEISLVDAQVRAQPELLPANQGTGAPPQGCSFVNHCSHLLCVSGDPCVGACLLPLGRSLLPGQSGVSY